jgi:hypothetical protein
VGADSVLSAAETSGARNLRFNASGSPFTARFNVIGNLARSAGGSGSGGGGSSGGAGGSGGSSGASSGTGAVTSMVFQVTYNPLLNTATVRLLQ